MNIQFNDEKEEKKLKEIREKEEEDLVQLLAETRYGVLPINLQTLPIDSNALRIIAEKDAIAQEIAPFKILGKNIHVAVRSPRKEKLDELKKYFNERGYTPRFYMSSLASLEKTWERYKEISYASQSAMGSISISGEVLKKTIQELNNIEDIKNTVSLMEKNSTHTTSHILETIIAGAISINASDIHFEPEERAVRLRYRLDGILQEIMTIPNEAHKFINSRIKLISGLKITTSAIAQDGRFSVLIDDNDFNMRVSVMPGAYGESIVIRILNPKSTKVKLEDLGIEQSLFNVFMEEIKKPNGLILLTGPTGSGKTTTLYSFLQRIYSTEIKIITVEDPIEYHLNGISQTQVDEEKGYTFLEGLRSAMRQDPDVIMIGEIRDNETAQTAVQASLTGHLVFSTLHTNDAAGVIPRLIDLKVNPKILVSALSLAIAQRLVRKLCVECKREKKISEKELTTINRIIDQARKNNKGFDRFGLEDNSTIRIYEAPGCPKCNGLGYKGRIGIFEAIKNTEEIEKIIPENPSERQIKEASLLQGTLNMAEDGILKILKGITSFEEVESAIDLYEE